MTPGILATCQGTQSYFPRHMKRKKENPSVRRRNERRKEEIKSAFEVINYIDYATRS